MMYSVEVIVLNKEGIRDPEGEAIKKYMVDKVTDKVKEVRAGKYVLFKIDAGSEEEAMNIAKKVADEKRLYNPIVHKVEIRVRKDEDGGH
ncbi:MAG: phosphoribosylformylglycinamidine synthase subunit PurS [Candidatus Aramenus sulfurataquae]|uniref:Phosphoribosylformylglycinamidine synthase subunit PurS n=3 Tax=Candidatus Aramenus sulfurataquae TaxID=1326980 RepID=A0A0F2LS35_9CREN|nr:phosphoribosylformylglycinamidine synthase subunit PurS [Candidatus Aramenus sulfurataquae]